MREQLMTINAMTVSAEPQDQRAIAWPDRSMHSVDTKAMAGQPKTTASVLRTIHGLQLKELEALEETAFQRSLIQKSTVSVRTRRHLH